MVFIWIGDFSRDLLTYDGTFWVQKATSDVQTTKTHISEATRQKTQEGSSTHSFGAYTTANILWTWGAAWKMECPQLPSPGCPP